MASSVFELAMSKPSTFLLHQLRAPWDLFYTYMLLNGNSAESGSVETMHFWQTATKNKVIYVNLEFIFFPGVSLCDASHLPVKKITLNMVLMAQERKRRITKKMYMQ